MGKLMYLDCTLRDGGYINDWRFGNENIIEMKEKLETTNVDIMELGFLKNEPYQEDRTVFNSMEQVKKLIGTKKSGLLYAIMLEVVNPLPLEMLAPADKDAADIVRVIIWKTKHTPDGKVVDAIEESYEYCKGIVEKGYRLCVQPARVTQYSDDEFVSMLKKFETLNPMAIYVVDSWGTMYKEDVLHYVHLAEKNLKQSIAIGYHGHNNMMQAFDIACAIASESKTNPREYIIDASVYGIGRGAGNLNLEIFAKYLNESFDRDFNLSPMFDIYDKFIKQIYEKQRWGFSIPYLITAKTNTNPNYALYYDQHCNLSSTLIEKIIDTIPETDRVLYTKDKAIKYMEQYNN